MNIYRILQAGQEPGVDIENLIASVMGMAGTPSVWAKDSTRRMVLGMAMERSIATTLLTRDQTEQFYQIMAAAQTNYRNLTSRTTEQVALFEHCRVGEYA